MTVTRDMLAESGVVDWWIVWAWEAGRFRVQSSHHVLRNAEENVASWGADGIPAHTQLAGTVSSYRATRVT